MAFIHWNADMETGISKIDEQHKKLVHLLNDLFDAMNSGKGKDALGIILHDLVEYTKFILVRKSVISRCMNIQKHLLML